MFIIPDDIQNNFTKALDHESIPLALRGFYRNWLRYYFDFCHKYQHDVWGRENLKPFIEKLAEKNQPANLKRQASLAITIFCKHCPTGQITEKRPDNSASSSSLQTSGSSISSGYSVPYSPLVAEEEPSDSINHTVALSVEDNGCDYQVINADWPSIFNGLKHETSIRHYSPRTLRSYSNWVRQLQTFTKSKSLNLLSSADVRDFLTYLAEERHVSASSQNQAFNALLFVFRHILKKFLMGLRTCPEPKENHISRWCCLGRKLIPS